MIAIEAGGWRAALLPERGGAFASLSLDGRDLLKPLAEGADPNATWGGAFLMLPWTNRLDGGRMPLPEGGEHAYPLNRPQEGCALHGLSRELPWEVEAVEAGRAVLAQRFAAEGQPYRYDARLEVWLGESLRLALTVTNRAGAPMAFGTGWHPFFLRPAGTRLRLKARQTFRRGPRGLPEAVLESAGIDGGEDAFNTLDGHFAGWDGTAMLTLGDRRVEMRADGAWRRNVQVFAPLDADVICVEPVSHVIDVVHRRDFAPLGDMRVLAPGESLSGEVSLRRG